MNSIPIDRLPARAAGHALALLGANHGYRFEGDIAYLNAKFTVMDAAAHERAWALQLWATPAAPTSDADLTGRLVAQAALPPIGEIADPYSVFETSAFALLPASPAGHYMVMTLVAGRSGVFDELHDLVLLPQRQTFQPLRLSGAVGYHIQGDRVQLTVERIENPRDTGNRSGTLSLELWALSAPFQGGSFRGIALGGANLEALSGQSSYGFHSFDVPFTVPPAGEWHLVLMLREWTPAGFVTRDFTNFTHLHSQPEAVAPLESLVFVEPEPVFPAPRLFEPTPDLPAAVEVLAMEPPVIEMQVPLPGRPRKKRKHSRRSRRPRTLHELSVNTARTGTLSTVKWLSKPVAKAIVAARPFTSLDDLLRVKGIGPKVLARIQPRLKL